MRTQLAEDLMVEDLANAALFSKYHFTRVFGKLTGLPPKHFLTALRLAEAKRLLAGTGSTVADISTAVGYTSPGTFSSRFARSVAIPPVGYRREMLVDEDGARCRAHASGPLLCGAVTGPSFSRGPLFLGLFPRPFAEGRPVAWTALSGPGAFVLHDVPAGEWFAVAYQLTDRHDTSHATAADRVAALARSGPIRTDGTLPTGGGDRNSRFDPRRESSLELRLRPPSVYDPPPLVYLVDAIARPTWERAA